MAEQELQVQQKREVEKEQEGTVPARVFLPVTDIFETDDALRVVLEMPDVNKESVDVSVENNVLLRPLYTEYNIGNYNRSFRLSSEIEQESIKAELKDGVMTLMLPKAAKAKPRKIKVG